jgi:hypothetical protein
LGTTWNIFLLLSVNALSMVITYPIAGALTGAYLPERVWDYSITIAVIHIAMSFLGKNIIYMYKTKLKLNINFLLYPKY